MYLDIVQCTMYCTCMKYIQSFIEIRDGQVKKNQFKQSNLFDYLKATKSVELSPTSKQQKAKEKREKNSFHYFITLATVSDKLREEVLGGEGDISTY